MSTFSNFPINQTPILVMCPSVAVGGDDGGGGVVVEACGPKPVVLRHAPLAE